MDGRLIRLDYDGFKKSLFLLLVGQLVDIDSWFLMAMEAI